MKGNIEERAVMLAQYIIEQMCIRDSRNTMNNRMEKIVELTGVDLQDAEAAFHLMFSFHILEYYGATVALDYEQMCIRDRLHPVSPKSSNHTNRRYMIFKAPSAFECRTGGHRLSFPRLFSSASPAVPLLS